MVGGTAAEVEQSTETECSKGVLPQLTVGEVILGDGVGEPAHAQTAE